jgi:hypothetical protein
MPIGFIWPTPFAAPSVVALEYGFFGLSTGFGMALIVQKFGGTSVGRRIVSRTWQSASPAGGRKGTTSFWFRRPWPAKPTA